MRNRLVVLAALLLAVARPALSGPGGMSDGPDSGGPLDIASVAHGDAASTVTYTVTFVNAVSIAQLDQLTWHIDFDRDGNEDGCVDVLADGGRLTGEVFGGKCGGAKVGSATASLADSTHVKVDVPLSALKSAGLQSGYRYSVESISFGSGAPVSDDVPNRTGKDPNMSIEHAEIDTSAPPAPTDASPAPGGTPARECPEHSGDPRPDVLGGAGNDVLVATNGSIACGVAGNDVLKAPVGGTALLEGGEGSDILCARQGVVGDELDGGPGVDRGRYDNSEAATSIERLAPLSACG